MTTLKKTPLSRPLPFRGTVRFRHRPMGLRAVRRAHRYPTASTSATSHDRFSLLGIRPQRVGPRASSDPRVTTLGNASGVPRLVGRRQGGLHVCPRPTRRRATSPARSTRASGRWRSAPWCSTRSVWTGGRRSMLHRRACSRRFANRIEAESGGAAEAAESAWYRGDLHHAHRAFRWLSVELRDMAAAATSAGLDFIVSTEHNTSSANRAWAASTRDGLARRCRRGGHHPARALARRRASARGLGRLAYGPRDGVFAALCRSGSRRRRPRRGRASIGAAAGLGCGSSASAHVDAIEVWNGIVERRRRSVAAHLASTACASGRPDHRGGRQRFSRTEPTCRSGRRPSCTPRTCRPA